MPTINPRLQLTLPPHRHALLKRLAGLQGVSMSALVVDILDEFYPVMERVCVVLEAAAQAQATSKQGLKDAVAQAEAELVPLAQATLSQFDLFMQRVEGSISSADSEGVVVGARAPAAAPKRRPKAPSQDASQGALNPRVVTRGSGSVTPLPSQASTNSRKARGTRSSAK